MYRFEQDPITLIEEGCAQWIEEGEKRWVKDTKYIDAHVKAIRAKRDDEKEYFVTEEDLNMYKIEEEPIYTNNLPNTKESIAKIGTWIERTFNLATDDEIKEAQRIHGGNLD
jgi:hypothetical protein